MLITLIYTTANGFTAPCMLGEKLQPGVVKATLVILFGCITAVASASHDNNVCDLDSLFALYRTARFAIYATVAALVMLLVFFFIKRCEGLDPESERYARLRRFHRISYAG
jgi:hypothetical protein